MKHFGGRFWRTGVGASGACYLCSWMVCISTNVMIPPTLHFCVIRKGYKIHTLISLGHLLYEADLRSGALSTLRRER